jgi:hypothetical protein
MQRHMFPHLLINSVIDGHTAKSLVKEARAFAQSRTSMTESYTPVAGATVTEVVSLGNGIDLVPWADVFNGNHRMLFYPDLSTPFVHMRARPNSAFRTRSTERQVLLSPSDDAEVAFEISKNEIIDQNIQIQDAVRCITTQSIRSIAVLGNWVQFDKKIANDLSGSGYSYNEALFDRAVSMASFNPVILDGDSIARMHNLFENFKPSEKEVMRVALDRLN